MITKKQALTNIMSDDKSQNHYTKTKIRNSLERCHSTDIWEDSKSVTSSKESDAIIFSSQWKLPGTVPKIDDVPDDHYDTRFGVRTLRTFSVIEPMTSSPYYLQNNHYGSCQEISKRRYSVPVEVHSHAAKQGSRSCDDLLEGIYDNVSSVIQQRQERADHVDHYDNFQINHSAGQYDNLSNALYWNTSFLPNDLEEGPQVNFCQEDDIYFRELRPPDDVTFIPPQRATMESPTSSMAPPGFGDPPRRGLPPSVTDDDEEDDEDSPSDLPPDLADLPFHIREQIDLMVQNDLDLGSQLSAIDALLLAQGLKHKDARMAGSGSSTGTGGPCQDNKLETVPDTMSDIDKFIASMAVPPPPGDNELPSSKPLEGATSSWCRAPPVGAEIVPPKSVEKHHAAKSQFSNGHLPNSGLPPPPNCTEVTMDEDMFRIFIPPSEFGLDIDLSQIPTTEVLEDEYLKYVLPPPPVSDVTVLEDIPIVPPVDPPSPFVEKSVVSELTKKLECKNLSFNPDSEIAKRAVVRPLQTEQGESNGLLSSKENGVTIHVSSNGASSRSPDTPSSVELNPKHSALWKPSQIRSADSSPVHKGKDFLSAALRGSTGTLNRRGRVAPPPPPRRSSIQPESAGSSCSGSPCSTPGAELPSGIPRRDPSRSSAYVNVFNFGSSAPTSPAARHRKISTNSTDSSSTASSVNSAEGSKKHNSNVREIKKLLESARLSRTASGARGNKTVKTGGGEQPASREQSLKRRESNSSATDATDDGAKESVEATNKEQVESSSPVERPVTMRNKTGEPSQRLRSTFKPDKSPTEMPNRGILDDDADTEIDLTSDLDLASDLDRRQANGNSSSASKLNPKHRSPSFQRKLLAFEISKASKKGTDDMDSAPKESPRSPRLGKDGVPRRSSLNSSRTSPLLPRHSGIGKFRSLFSKSDSDRHSDTECSQSCPTSPRPNYKSFTLGRSGLRGFGLNNQNKDHSRKGIPTRVVKPMMMMSNSDGETSPPPTSKDFSPDFKNPPKNRNSIASTLASEWVGNMDFDPDATYKTFSTFKESPKRRRQPVTFSTFRADPKTSTNKDNETSKKNEKNFNATNGGNIKTNGEKVPSDDHSVDRPDNDHTERVSSFASSNAGRRQVFPEECLNKSSPQNTSPSKQKPAGPVSQETEVISHKLYDVPDVFKEIDKDADTLANTVVKTLKDLNIPSCRKPSEEFQGHKDKLVIEARQFVTDSKLLVSSATQSLDRLTDNVISSMHTLAKLVGHGQDVMLTVRSVPQAHNLGSRLQDVLHAYRLTVSAARSAVGLPLSDPPMKLLMKQATNLAAILSNLMKTLKILENS